jgi:hypothetical protein
MRRAHGIEESRRRTPRPLTAASKTRDNSVHGVHDGIEDARQPGPRRFMTASTSTTTSPTWLMDPSKTDEGGTYAALGSIEEKG